MKMQRKNLTSLEPRKERSFQYCKLSESHLNEMWFLTIDPFIRISPYSSQSFPSDNTAGVLSKTSSQEYPILWSTQLPLHASALLSIGGFDSRRTARFRQRFHFSRTQVLFVIKFPFLKFKSWCRQAPFFRRWEECCSLTLFLIWYTFGQLLHCFTGTSLLPLCLFLRLILKFWSVGATLMRCTWAEISERRILVRNFSVTCNSFREFHTLDWFLHVWALPKDRLRRHHVVKDTTQLMCVQWSSSNRSLFQLMTSITLDIGSPRSLVTFVTVDNRLPYAFVQTILLQHGCCTYVIIILGLLPGCSSTWRCANEHFPNLQPLLVLQNKHSGGCHFSQNELLQVPWR